jgi:hypothetical protein
VLGDYLLLWKTFDSGFKKEKKNLFLVSIPHMNGTRNLIPSLFILKKFMALVLV